LNFCLNELICIKILYYLITYTTYITGVITRKQFLKHLKNYDHFLYLWKKHVNPIADSLVYSLQPNHFHFLVRTKEVDEDDDKQSKKIQQSFSNFFNAYSKSINNAYNRTGSLLQERFGRKLIDTEDYFTQIIWYIHSNSQKHGIIKDFRDYPYCSYKSILSKKPTLLLREEVLEWFGNREVYITFHEGNQNLSVDYLKDIEF